VIHHALLISKGHVLGEDDLQLSPMTVQRRGDEDGGSIGTPQEALGQVLRTLFNEPSESLYEDIEDAIMREAFQFCHRNQVQAAKLLGISRNVLRSRLIKSKEISALK